MAFGNPLPSQGPPTKGDGIFEPLKFSGWPELKEAFLSGHTKATFILAPMAIALREQGIPIKIVYLCHRDGTALMVGKDSDIRSIADLRGKTVAVPNRYSNQRLLIFRALNNAGMSIDDIKLIEMPPPDMPAALYSKAVDAVTSGEPFMGQCEPRFAKGEFRGDRRARQAVGHPGGHGSL